MLFFTGNDYRGDFESTTKMKKASLNWTVPVLCRLRATRQCVDINTSVHSSLLAPLNKIQCRRSSGFNETYEFIDHYYSRFFGVNYEDKDDIVLFPSHRFKEWRTHQVGKSECVAGMVDDDDLTPSTKPEDKTAAEKEPNESESNYYGNNEAREESIDVDEKTLEQQQEPVKPQRIQFSGTVRFDPQPGLTGSFCGLTCTSPRYINLRIFPVCLQFVFFA